MSIGEKIYKLRKEKNMSQEALADVLNVSRQTISKWETGESNPEIEKIVLLCDYFNISTDELLKGNSSYLEKEIAIVQKKNKALMLSMCIVIFVVMMILVITIDEVGGNDPLVASICLIGIGSIAIILVYYFLARPSDGKGKKKEDVEKRKLINSIVNMLIVIIYFLYSYFFRAWAISWIIFIVGALVKKIIMLMEMLRSGEDEQE